MVQEAFVEWQIKVQVGHYQASLLILIHGHRKVGWMAVCPKICLPDLVNVLIVEDSLIKVGWSGHYFVLGDVQSSLVPVASDQGRHVSSPA